MSYQIVYCLIVQYVIQLRHELTSHCCSVKCNIKHYQCLCVNPFDLKLVFQWLGHFGEGFFVMGTGSSELHWWTQGECHPLCYTAFLSIRNDTIFYVYSLWKAVAIFYIFLSVNISPEKTKANSVSVSLSILFDFPTLSVTIGLKLIRSYWRCYSNELGFTKG